MRGARGIVVVGLALCSLLAGCLPRYEGSRTARIYDRVRGWSGLGSGGDGGLYVQTAIVDQPAPDPFLTTDLWSSGTTTNPLPAETSALLEVNGLRVRITGGIPPAKLQSLLNDEVASVSPMVRSLKPGVPKVVPVNGPTDGVRIGVRRELKVDVVPTEWDAVECGLSLNARPTDGGRVAIRCEPQVQHGDRQSWLRPAADGAGFTRQEQKPLDTYPTLGFEVTLGTGDYLIVGPSVDAVGTLGQAFFYAAAKDHLHQRVLVVRAGRFTDAPSETRPTRMTTAAAAQAISRPTARGTSR